MQITLSPLRKTNKQKHESRSDVVLTVSPHQLKVLHNLKPEDNFNFSCTLPVG